MDRLLNGVKGYAAAQAGALGAPRMGIVTSYNQADGTAKVLIQPEGTLTGWLPVMSQSIGSGWGLHVPFKSGEQVMVLPHDGDADSGVIVGRVYNDTMRPPDTTGADFVLKSSGGAIITLMTNGQFIVQDAAGSIVKLTNDGNMTLNAPNSINMTCETFTVNASTSATITSPMTNVSNELDVGSGPIKQNHITVIVP